MYKSNGAFASKWVRAIGTVVAGAPPRAGGTVVVDAAERRWFSPHSASAVSSKWERSSQCTEGAVQREALLPLVPKALGAAKLRSLARRRRRVLSTRGAAGTYYVGSEAPGSTRCAGRTLRSSSLRYVATLHPCRS